MTVSKIENSLHDIHRICTENKTRYFVIGSAAFAGAAGKIYRPIHDVDFLYDIDKKEILRKALESLGYKRTLQYHPLNVFPKPLERYEKNGQIIEPREGIFSDNDRFTINFRPPFKLVFTKTMIECEYYKSGKASFYGLNKEALWLGLHLFMELFFLFENDNSKRKLDLEVMSRGIDRNRLKRIIKESPGLYYKNIPVATTHNTAVLRLVINFLKLKKLLKLKPSL